MKGGDKMSKCLFCGKDLIKSQTKYCSSSCQQQHKTELYIQDWLNGEEDGLSGQFGLSKRVRNYMLKKANYKCELCGWGEINPYTNTLPLEIHHKDGDYRHNEESNLQVLCPNCHSLTATIKGANKNGREDRIKYVSRKNYCIDCGVEIASTSMRCRSCASKKELPITREELKDLIRIKPFTKIGEQYQVSDNAIRKWCDKYNLPRKATDIKKYSDEEWELI